jgi:aspartyl-tRNA(Asn)/glutamyl-tRNA(Gln) amidotransferase subunit A
MIRAGEVSPVEVVSHYLDRISTIDAELRTYITVAADSALAEAHRAEEAVVRGRVSSPLHGIPVSLKDNIDTRGIRTTDGSEAHRDRIPTRDALVVDRLREAGAIILGKASLTEFALSSAERDHFFPPTRNPWNRAWSSGSSSNGSAAGVAARLSAASIGSDTGGSIRGPSAFCGTVGLKPTYELVSRRGVTPVAWSLDHVGPITRTVRDAAIVLDLIAEPDRRADGAARQSYSGAIDGAVKGQRVGVPWSYIDSRQISPEVRANFATALRLLGDLGIEVRDVELPLAEHCFSIFTTIAFSESAAFHRTALAEGTTGYSDGFRRRLAPGFLISAADYVNAQRARTRFRAGVARVMTTVDALALPTMPRPAPDIQDLPVSPPAAPGPDALEPPQFTQLFNLTGQPAVTVPSGFTADGRPLGLMLAGALHSDASVLRIAGAYEEIAGWTSHVPAWVSGGFPAIP